MNLFKSSTLNWWQMGIFKLSLLSLGLVLGAYWQEYILPYSMPLLILAAITGLYIAVTWFR